MQIVIWGADQSTTVLNVPLLGVPIDPSALASINGAVEDAQTAATQAQDAAVEAAEAAVAVPEIQADLRDIKEGAALTDGGAAVVTLDESGDLIRMYDDGLDLVPGRALTNRVYDNGAEAGDINADGGRVIEVLEGSPLRKLYPDGQDFIPSERFSDRLRDAGLGGGGLTADGWATAPDGSFTAQAAHRGINAVDRFTTSGGARYPVAMVNGVTRKAIIVSVWGQSNADWQKVGDLPLWDVPPFMNHVFMLGDMSTNTNRGGIVGWGSLVANPTASMVQCAEGAQAIQSYGATAISRAIMEDGPVRRVGIARSSALGGQKLVGDDATSGIWKNSVGDYRQPWLNWTVDLQSMHDAVTAAGYEVEAVYICFTHQEEDWQTARATYLSQFAEMKGEREALIEAAWPGMKVHWFVDQASGSGYRVDKYQGGAWPDRMAIYDATLPVNGGDNITMVMPRYWMTMGLTGALAQETIHHSSRSKVWQGEMYAHAMLAAERGQAWRCPVMTAATVSGNDVIVDFDSIEPLVIDPTFCKVRPDMGFVIGNGAVVTGVRLTGQRQVTVSCATAPATSISYAYRTQDGSDVSDEWPISTGAIRDAWEAPSIFDPGKRLVRAALGFQLTL